MKCYLCNHTKGKRTCIRCDNQLICSRCCGITRNFKDCNTECEYFPEEKFELLPTSSVEFTEVGRGKVTLFSESLFLPNICDCLYIDIDRIDINIKNPVLISIDMEFEIKGRNMRKVTNNEIYLKDKWKRNDKLLPFLQIYTIGTGDIYNEKLFRDNIEERIIIENNHGETWLPYSVIEQEKISKIQKDKLNIHNDKDNTLYPISKGKHFLGKNNCFFADIQIDKQYIMKFDIYYDSIHTIENYVLINLGLFFPFKLVNFKDYKVNLLNNYSFSKKSEVQLLLPYDQEEINAFLIPLDNTRLLSSPRYIKYSFESMEKFFHYNEYVILNHNFYLDSKEKEVVYSTSKALPIFTGIYDTFNKVYNNEYAPVNITIFNDNDEIRRYKVETEIYGLSYKKIQEVYVEPHSINNTKIAPQLIDDEIDKITSNTEKDIYIKVSNDNSIIYENTNKCLIYPKEVFVEKLENNRKDWKIDFRSFLARWITPNSKVIDNIISKATQDEEILGGITTNSMRTEKDIKKIYDTLSNLKYSIRTLAFPEGDYHIQRVSLPQNTVNLMSGNCIDLSILLASCFEAIKIKTFIVLIPRHAMVMVELGENTRICIESTCLGNKEYHEAAEIGRKRFEEHFNSNKEPLDHNSYILDVNNARKSKIFPMN